jgi:hypothetical protein
LSNHDSTTLDFIGEAYVPSSGDVTRVISMGSYLFVGQTNLAAAQIYKQNIPFNTINGCGIPILLTANVTTANKIPIGYVWQTTTLVLTDDTPANGGAAPALSTITMIPTQ